MAYCSISMGSVLAAASASMGVGPSSAAGSVATGAGSALKTGFGTGFFTMGSATRDSVSIFFLISDVTRTGSSYLANLLWSASFSSTSQQVEKRRDETVTRLRSGGGLTEAA